MDAYDCYRELQRVDTFTVTEDHLKLLRAAYVSWDDCEFGAPSIDCKRPYGNSRVLADIAEIVDPGAAPTEEDYDSAAAYDAWMERDGDRLTRLHAETSVALQIVLRTGEFKPGTYTRPKYTEDWALVEDAK